MMKKYIILILILFIGTIHVMSQTKGAYLNAAQTAYENEDYYSALAYYKEALEFKDNKLEIYNHAANAAFKAKAYTLADSLYSVVLENEDNNQFPEAMFYAAEVKQKLGDYAKAKEYYSLYISEQAGENPDLTAKAELELKSIDWALNALARAGADRDSVERLEYINTPFSDFGSFKMEENLYFSSLRFENEEKGVHPNKLYSKILFAEGDGDNGDVFGESLGDDPNSHVAHTTFNEDYSQMYFTMCEYITVDNIRCDLYRVGFKDGEIEGTPNLIPLDNSGNTITYTQPSWGKIGDKEVLFFVSDREGGLGEEDIWYIEINEDGSYGDPVNLSDLNTVDSDITPFYDRSSETLYFSSEGYQGFGGYDIYSSRSSEDGWSTPFNVGSPLNSSYDDIYPMIDIKSQKMYFSSNRVGSLFLDNELETCCYDIYKGELPYMQHQLIAQVFDGYTQDSVPGATVSLLYQGSVDVIDTQRDPDLAQYRFRIQRDRNYLIQGTKEGYLPGITEFSTADFPDTGDVVQKVYLNTKELHLDVFVFDGTDNTALRGAEITSIDNSKNTRDTTNWDSNKFHYALDRDKTYTFIVSRKGYSPVTFELNPADYVNQSHIVKNIYLLMGDLKDFLPLVLYFDNDRPNPRSWSKGTDVLYTETYDPYYSRKGVFIDKFTEPMTGPDRDDAARQLNNFFEAEVKKGNVDLNKFFVLLERALKDGKKVEIYLKGYTSPRASVSYNFVLGMRRIQSVKNNLVEYNDGIFKEYIKTGQLELRLKSFGKTTAPKDVVSDLADERNSIYSYKASKERRVEIIGINIE